MLNPSPQGYGRGLEWLPWCKYMVARVLLVCCCHILTRTENRSNNTTRGKIWLTCRLMQKKSIWRGNSRDDIWNEVQQQRDESEEKRIQSSVAHRRVCQDLPHAMSTWTLETLPRHNCTINSLRYSRYALFRSFYDLCLLRQTHEQIRNIKCGWN